MKTARILWIGVVVLLIGAPSAGAQGRTSEGTPPAPSLFEGFSTGTKRFLADTGTGVKTFFAKTNAGTKRFFAGTRNALTWKSPAAKKKKEPKRSWLDSLLGREEPKPIRSLDDWWELKRMDP